MLEQYLHDQALHLHGLAGANAVSPCRDLYPASGIRMRLHHKHPAALKNDVTKARPVPS